MKFYKNFISFRDKIEAGADLVRTITSLFSQGGPFSSEADIQRGPGLKKKDTKYHYNLKFKIKIKKNMV